MQNSQRRNTVTPSALSWLRTRYRRLSALFESASWDLRVPCRLLTREGIMTTKGRRGLHTLFILRSLRFSFTAIWKRVIIDPNSPPSTSPFYQYKTSSRTFFRRDFRHFVVPYCQLFSMLEWNQTARWGMHSIAIWKVQFNSFTANWNSVVKDYNNCNPVEKSTLALSPLMT